MIGTQVGSWVIESQLGKGGMGQVYLARHKSLDTLAAVKVLAPTLDEEEFRQRFFQEAKTQARLRHPNIAHVLDYVEQDGKWFLVVEYMEKGSLADQLQSQTQPVPALGAINYSRQALAGLGHAHTHGVVHRDVKPANLLLNERNEVAVTDFGIAKVEGETRLTGTGLSVGTPRYMSPEQITDPKGVDHRCDIYSLGVVLYQLLLGRLPFESDSGFEILRAQVYETPPPMREIDSRIPPELERIVLRALAKRPEERYANCDEFAEALAAWFAKGEPLPAGTRDLVSTLVVPRAAVASPGSSAEPTARPAVPFPPRTVAASSSPAASRAAAEPVAARPASSRALPVAAALAAVLLLGGAAAFLFLRGVLPRWTGRARGPAAVERVGATLEAARTSAEQAAEPAASAVLRAPAAPRAAAVTPDPDALAVDAGAPAVSSPAPGAPFAGAPTKPPTRPAEGVAGSAEPAETARSAAGATQLPLRATPRILVVGAGEPALAAAAQDALSAGLASTGEVVTGRSLPHLADRLRGGASPGIGELLGLARTADVDVLVLADAQLQGDEYRSTGARDFVALTSRLELTAFVVPANQGIGPGWNAQVRYAAASAATYGGRAIDPLLASIAEAVEDGWRAYRQSVP